MNNNKKKNINKKYYDKNAELIKLTKAMKNNENWLNKKFTCADCNFITGSSQN